jgi:hypothetical protein
MSLAERVRAALRGGMYSTVKGQGMEALILKDGIAQGVVTIASGQEQA